MCEPPWGRGYANSAARNFARADTIRSVRPRAVDHFLERNVFFALGAADQAHLLEVVLGLEEVALFGMPHAVIGPGQSVFGICGKRLVVPIFGVVIAAQLAARIAEQCRYVGIVVVLQGAERGDAALIIVFVVNQCISGMITVDEVLGRAGFIFLVFLGLAGRLLRGPLRPSRVPSHTTGAAATHRGSKLRGARDSRRKDDGCKHRSFAHGSSGFGWLVPWSPNECVSRPDSYPGVLVLLVYSPYEVPCCNRFQAANTENLAFLPPRVP